ncbi:hypothetical protein D9M71_831880 [compost metagenome]
MGVQRAHFRVAFVGVFHRMVRVHARGRVQKLRMLAGQIQRHRRMLAAGAGDHHLHHPRLARTRQHGVAVAIKGIVGEVGADIDQLHGAAAGRETRPLYLRPGRLNRTPRARGDHGAPTA